jgi:acetyl esterase/lipase
MQDVAASVDHLALMESDALRQAQGTLGEARGTLGEAQGTLGEAQGTLGDAQGTSGDAQVPSGDARGTLDLGRVIALGHSAGGQLAAWLAGVDRPRVQITGVVSQAGVLDLAAAAADQLGRGAVVDFLGPEWTGDWALASPAHRLPIRVPIRCVHGDLDDSVPIGQSATYVAAARDLGCDAALITVPDGDHFGVITPGDPGWTACLQAVEELAGRP